MGEINLLYFKIYQRWIIRWKKGRHRLIDQSRKCRNRPTQVSWTDLNKGEKEIQKYKDSLSTNHAGAIAHPLGEKINFNLSLILYEKINLDIKYKAAKSLEKGIGENL